MAKYKERVMVNGIERWVTANTRHELHLAIARALLQGGEVTMPAGSSNEFPTVRDFVEQIYLPTYIQMLAPKTVENYKQYLKLNILPFLGDMRLNEVTVSTIQQFYNWMAEGSLHGHKKNLNRRSIERIGGLTSRIFKVAFEMKLIDDMPFKNTLLSIRAEPASHHKVLPDSEIKRIKQEIPQMESMKERVFMGLLAYTGMRLEEVLGLRWEDVNLPERYCEITHTVTYPGNNQPCVREGGKTLTSCRTVILPEPLVAILQSVPTQTGFLIGGEHPLCWASYQRMRRKAFAKCMKNQRVVEMQFDNQQFERGVQTSVKSLEDLKKGLDLEGSARSLSSLEKAGKAFSLAGIADSVNPSAISYWIPGNSLVRSAQKSIANSAC